MAERRPSRRPIARWDSPFVASAAVVCLAHVVSLVWEGAEPLGASPGRFRSCRHVARPRPRFLAGLRPEPRRRGRRARRPARRRASPFPRRRSEREVVARDARGGAPLPASVLSVGLARGRRPSSARCPRLDPRRSHCAADGPQGATRRIGGCRGSTFAQHPRCRHRFRASCGDPVPRQRPPASLGRLVPQYIPRSRRRGRPWGYGRLPRARSLPSRLVSPCRRRPACRIGCPCRKAALRPSSRIRRGRESRRQRTSSRPDAARRRGLLLGRRASAAEEHRRDPEQGGESHENEEDGPAGPRSGRRGRRFCGCRRGARGGG